MSELNQILDACVYQWGPAAIATPGYCESAMKKTQDKIDKELKNNIDALLTETKKHLAPATDKTSAGKIYVTGYARFFGEGPGCDSVSWSYWDKNPSPIKLTSANRKIMNKMVVNVNTVLRDLINR